MPKLTEAEAMRLCRHGAVDLKAPGWDGSYEDLSRVDFYGADLTRANLSYATLNGKFRNATLCYANLSHTKRASFDECDLTGANLDGADLSNSQLYGDVKGASLRGADLRGCRLAFAKNLTQADLRGAKGSRLNKLIRRRQGLRENGIVPFAVKGVSQQVQGRQFLISDLCSRRIGSAVLQSRDG